MTGIREKAKDIIMKHRQVEVLQEQCKLVSDAIRRIGVTIQTYYRWCREYGGMKRDNAKRLADYKITVGMLAENKA